MDCVNCLIGFANNKSSHRISLKAIALLRICEDRLAEVIFPVLCFSFPFKKSSSLDDVLVCYVSFLIHMDDKCNSCHLN